MSPERDWDPELRKAAADKATKWGVWMIGLGLALAFALVLLDRVVTVWVFALPALPITLGVIAVFPDIFTPLAYRTLDEIDGRRQGGGDDHE